MEFQKSKVYTALSADELEIGSKVIVGDTVEALRNRVQNGTTPLTLSEIRRDSYERRFRVEEYTEPESVFSFVYFISEPEEKNWIAYLCRRKGVKPYLTCCRSDCWEEVQKDFGAKTKLFEGTEEETNDWYEARKQFADAIAAWEDGKTIQFNSGYGWEDCCNNRPAWDVTSEYRIKPESLKWTDLKIGDVIQNKKYTHSMMIIGIDHREETKSHIFDGVCWLDDDDLEYWEKVE